jgi:hypothetical protein
MLALIIFISNVQNKPGIDDFCILYAWQMSEFGPKIADRKDADSGWGWVSVGSAICKSRKRFSGSSA